MVYKLSVPFSAYYRIHAFSQTTHDIPNPPPFLLSRWSILNISTKIKLHILYGLHENIIYYKKTIKVSLSWTPRVQCYAENIPIHPTIRIKMSNWTDRIWYRTNDFHNTTTTWSQNRIYDEKRIRPIHSVTLFTLRHTWYGLCGVQFGRKHNLGQLSLRWWSTVGRIWCVYAYLTHRFNPEFEWINLPDSLTI